MYDQIRTILTTICVLVCAFISGCATGIEELEKRTSPDGKWVILEEYYSSPSNFRIILRGADGKDIAKDAERHVESYLIDVPSDWRSRLEITNETAGREGHPIWRLDHNDGKWHLTSDSELPIKSEELAP